MTEALYPVPAEWAENALIDADRYTQMYRESVEDPESFWRREAQRIDWIKPFSEVRRVSFDEDEFCIRWFADGVLNASVNCLDRHLRDRAQRTAILWEGDDPSESRAISSPFSWTSRRPGPPASCAGNPL